MKSFNSSILAMSFSVLFHHDAGLQTLFIRRLTVLLSAISMSPFYADYLQLLYGLSTFDCTTICRCLGGLTILFWAKS